MLNKIFNQINFFIIIANKHDIVKNSFFEKKYDEF